MSVSLTPEVPVAVVTGSSSGIGRATALALSRSGYAVVLHTRRNLAGMQAVAGEIQLIRSLPSGSSLCLTGDIASPWACNDIVRTAFAWRGRVDVWVNNAGANVLTGAGRQLPFSARLQRLLEVDVQGTICLSRLVASRLMDQPVSGWQADRLPCIINLGWDQAALGMEGEPGQLFGPTKAAVSAFTSSFAMSHPNIRINCVAPGWIQTEWGQTSADEYWSRRAIDESLLQRWGSPEDVAQTIAWLVSDAARFVNGQTLAVNGGRRYYPNSPLG